MKKILILLFFIFLVSIVLPQSIRPIEDPHIRAQQDRMVYRTWGDWLPKRKMFLGVQVNIHHTMTWGWMAPNQNERYMKGSDIRPLGPTGEQTQREASLYAMGSQNAVLQRHSDELAKTAISELYNYTGGVISEVDPLWQLYYKRMLRDVKDYNLSTFTNRLTPKQRQYLNENGVLSWFDNEMQRLSERLNGAFNVTMDRGSRIINYHRIFIEYEQVLNRWNNQRLWSETLVNIKDERKRYENTANIDFSDWKNDDVSIMNKVIEDAKKNH